MERYHSGSLSQLQMCKIRSKPTLIMSLRVVVAFLWSRFDVKFNSSWLNKPITHRELTKQWKALIFYTQSWIIQGEWRQSMPLFELIVSHMVTRFNFRLAAECLEQAILRSYPIFLTVCRFAIVWKTCSLRIYKVGKQ